MLAITGSAERRAHDSPVYMRAHRAAVPLHALKPAEFDGRSRNALLAALPEEDLAVLRPHLCRIVLKRRQVLQERNINVTHAYFIESGAASLFCWVSGRGYLEVGTLGSRDFLGTAVVLGTLRAPCRSVVQVPGEALRIRAQDLICAMDQSPTLRSLLLAYVQARLVQSTQLVVCNTHHNLK